METRPGNHAQDADTRRPIKIINRTAEPPTQRRPKTRQPERERTPQGRNYSLSAEQPPPTDGQNARRRRHPLAAEPMAGALDHRQHDGSGEGEPTPQTAAPYPPPPGPIFQKGKDEPARGPFCTPGANFQTLPLTARAPPQARTATQHPWIWHPTAHPPPRRDPGQRRQPLAPQARAGHLHPEDTPGGYSADQAPDGQGHGRRAGNRQSTLLAGVWGEG